MPSSGIIMLSNYASCPGSSILNDSSLFNLYSSFIFDFSMYFTTSDCISEFITSNFSWLTGSLILDEINSAFYYSIFDCCVIGRTSDVRFFTSLFLTFMFEFSCDILISEILIPPYLGTLPSNQSISPSCSSSFLFFLLSKIEVSSLLIPFDPGASRFELLFIELGLLRDDSPCCYSWITTMFDCIFFSANKFQSLSYLGFLSTSRPRAEAFTLLTPGVCETFIQETATLQELFQTQTADFLRGQLAGVFEPSNQEGTFYACITSLFLMAD